MVVKGREKLCDIESNYTRVVLFEPTSTNEMGEVYASVDGGMLSNASELSHWLSCGTGGGY